MGEALACMGYLRNGYKILVRRSGGRRQLARNRSRWEDNIGMDLNGDRLEGADWRFLAQVRDQWQALLNTVMNLWFP